MAVVAVCGRRQMVSAERSAFYFKRLCKTLAARKGKCSLHFL